MQAIKTIAPLALSIALFGCNQSQPPAENQSAPTAQASSATATANPSNMTAEQHMDAREDIMSAWGKNSKAMRGMLENPSNFNAEEFKKLAQDFNQDVWVHFPETAKGDSKPEIWTDSAKFQQEIDKFKTAVKALNDATATATNADAVKAQFGEVGASCKSCHQSFKKD